MFEANIWFWLFLLGSGPSKEQLAAEIREGIKAERTADAAKKRTADAAKKHIEWCAKRLSPEGRLAKGRRLAEERRLLLAKWAAERRADEAKRKQSP